MVEPASMDNNQQQTKKVKENCQAQDKMEEE
jgi:hypothetical protein